jgi:reverse transcriptase-like protein
VLPGKLVLKTKRDKDGRIIKRKARWVVKGFRQQYGKDFDQTFAGVCKNVTWKIAIAMAALYDLEIEQMDVVGAFLNSEADTDIYVEVPPNWKEDNKPLQDAPEWACKLLKALYGLRQAPRLWQKLLATALQDLGFEACASDQCVYLNKETGILIITYVDDMLIIGKDKDKIRTLKKNLMKRFEIEDLGPAKYFVGVRITRDRKAGTISLCQDAYIKKVLKRYNMENCHPVDTPMAAGLTEFMIPYNGRATNIEIETYGSKIGSLMYLAVQTRPDIAYGVSVLSRFLTNPSPQHIKAADCILQYLQGTKMLGIEYKSLTNAGDTDLTLYGYCDADYTGDKSQRKSVSGNVYFFAGGAISYSSKRQPTVALSTTEAEYYALTKAVTEALWLKQIMSQMNYSGHDIKSIRVYGDNQGSLSLGENPEFHQRTKHIDIKHHFIQEHIAKGEIDLWYIKSSDMVADGLTKPLTAANHTKFIDQLKLKVIQVNKP